MAAAAVLEPWPYGDKLSTTNSKDWFTQTDITKQESTDVMTQYENQRFLWDDIEKLEIQSCDSESQTDLLCSLPLISVDISTQKGIIAADSYTQHNVSVTDSATQNQINILAIQESKSVEVGVQIQQVLADKEIQKEVKVVDAGIQHGALIQFEDKETCTDSETESSTSKNYADVFIQAVINDLGGVSKSCQCFANETNQNETSEQGVQTHEVILPKRNVELQAVQEYTDVAIQNHYILSSMRAQTESAVVCDQCVQTVFSPYSRLLTGGKEIDARSEKMEVYTQTPAQNEQVEQVNQALNQDRIEKALLITKEKTLHCNDSFSQYDYLSVETTHVQINTDFSTDNPVSAICKCNGSTSCNSLANTQDSMTQYEADISDSTIMTQTDVSTKTDSATNAKQLLLIDSFTQYECLTTSTLESSDKLSQYENQSHILDVMTQYDLIDLSDTPGECVSRVDRPITLEDSASASISATKIRDNLVQEERNNSKVTILRGKVEDCLQNWQWYQTEQNESDEKSEAEYYVEEYPNIIDEQRPSNDFPAEKDIAGGCSQVQIDKHSFGDAVFASVRGKRSSKRPAGSRKFCIVM